MRKTKGNSTAFLLQEDKSFQMIIRNDRIDLLASQYIAVDLFLIRSIRYRFHEPAVGRSTYDRPTDLRPSRPSLLKIFNIRHNFLPVILSLFIPFLQSHSLISILLFFPSFKIENGKNIWDKSSKTRTKRKKKKGKKWLNEKNK